MPLRFDDQLSLQLHDRADRVERAERFADVESEAARTHRVEESRMTRLLRSIAGRNDGERAEREMRRDDEIVGDASQAVERKQQARFGLRVISLTELDGAETLV